MDDQHILTAAHCIVGLSNAAGLIVDRDQNLFRIGVGSTKSSPPLHEVTVKAAFVHRGFSPTKGYVSHDIAVLRLNEPLSVLAGWETLIKPVCLPAETEIAPPRCEMTGWGRTDPTDSRSLSKELQRLDLDVYNHDTCVSRHPKMFNAADLQNVKPHILNLTHRLLFDNGQICSGSSTQGAHGICLGDSGGPLVCRTDNGSVFKQFGVVSWTAKRALCGSTPGYASVYTSVPFYRGWLEYVALNVLENVDKAQTWLDCRKKKCLRLAENRNRDMEVLERNKQCICEVFAAYDYCVEHDPKPDRCKNTVVPIYFDRKDANPGMYWRADLVKIFEVYRSAEFEEPLANSDSPDIVRNLDGRGTANITS